jgi:hypothetical protein
MTIEQIVEVPANHRITIDVPPEIPAGKTNVILTFPTPSAGQASPIRIGFLEGGVSVPADFDTMGQEEIATTSAPFPSIDELKKEARQKTADRFADPSGDSIQKYCGSLQNIFTEDGVTIQRRIRDEWPD